MKPLRLGCKPSRSDATAQFSARDPKMTAMPSCGRRAALSRLSANTIVSSERTLSVRTRSPEMSERESSESVLAGALTAWAVLATRIARQARLAAFGTWQAWRHSSLLEFKSSTAGRSVPSANANQARPSRSATKSTRLCRNSRRPSGHLPRRRGGKRPPPGRVCSSI